MISLKPRQMTEEEIVKKLEIVLNSCDAAELKTKKFVGLLNDHIAYNNGLKVRLELLGKAGYIEQLQKMRKDTNNQAKVEKLAVNFAKEYGFIYEECLDTFQLLVRAMAFKPMRLETPALKIVSSVQTGQGNFSKKHLAEEEKAISVKDTSTNKGQLQSETKRQTETAFSSSQKRKFVRNKMNLALYVFLLFIIPSGYYTLQSNFGTLPVVTETLKQYLYWPIQNNSNVISILVITLLVSLIPFIVNRLFKFNLLGIYPMLMLLFQIILVTVAPRVPELYIYLQAALGIILLISYVILGFYSMRLPKGAKEYTANRAIMPYYLMTAIWFVSQYIVLTKV
ncbi:hypothetical protein [Fusibacter bizertensis]